LTAATVVVPTHDHGPTLLRSIRSALAQTVDDLELFVIGDGVPDVTREIMAELTAADPRVRFFDHPKGPRHGEAYRHEALQQAQGEIVCYLSDDDLWLPGHVEELRGLLADADFAHTRPLWVDTDGQPRPWLVDLARPFYRELLLGGENRIPHPCAGHTLELYRRLPAGWRTTPHGTPTDLYMWQQILSVPGCRAVSGQRPTVLHFPSPLRTGWSSDERLAELDSWVPRLADPALERELADGLQEALVTDAEALDESTVRLRRELVDVDRERAHLSRRLDRLAAELRAVDEERARLAGQLDGLSSSVTWRLRARLIGIPGLGALLRAVARALARPAAPEAAGSPHRVRRHGPTAPATGSLARDRPSDTTARPSDPSTR
jgi:glycosyltransferase involved in cell wall biosynthesis